MAITEVGQRDEDNVSERKTLFGGISFGPKTSVKTTTISQTSQKTTLSNDTSSIDDLAARIMENSPMVRSSSSSTSVKSKTKPKSQRKRRPGFGLLQWNRLVHSSKDLAQRKGAPYRKNISIEEVRQHNQIHDGWMVLKGVVYNIGPYLPYHPGGEEIMEQCLGEDVTELFDRYHSWVSIEGLIGTLAIGSVAASNPNDEEGSGTRLVTGSSLAAVQEDDDDGDDSF